MVLYGIAEPPGLLAPQHFAGLRREMPVLRDGEDIVEHIFDRHLRLGVRNVIWQLGRSFLTYHTDHPLLTLQGSLAESDGGDAWRVYLRRTCPLRKALDEGAGRGMGVWGWLCMNRHYGDSHGGANFTRFERDHRQEMAEYYRDGSRDWSRLCYGFEEFRQERLAAVVEAAKVAGPASGRRLDAIVVDFVRQPPILLYHPRLCEACRRQTGRDPLAISATDAPDFLAWCTWRSAILTDFMRTLCRELAALAERTGWKVRLVPRITDQGPNINLVEGVDIATWCAEGLIDGIVTSPLNWARTVWEHDLRPYVKLARPAGIPVIAGVSLNQQTRFHGNGGAVSMWVLARRVHDYQRQGADGIALYQSECGLEFDGVEDVIPALADPKAAAALVEDEAFQARWPMTHLNCTYGLDCHSWFNDYAVDSHDHHSRPM